MNIDTQTLVAIGAAATKIAALQKTNEELRAALQFIADGYDNHDVNHLDYRVKVYEVALDALQRTEP